MVTVTDPHLDASATSITLNGQPFTSGTLVASAGSDTLTVQARDTLGHTSTSTVTFTVSNSTSVTLTAGTQVPSAC